MNIDFFIYRPPSCSKKASELWGELIRIPVYQNPEEAGESEELSFNCFKKKTKSAPTVFNDKDIVDLDPKPREQERTKDSPKIKFTIPCLFLLSGVESEYLLLYLHSVGEDIVNSFGLLDHLRKIFQINVLAMEYPGYSFFTDGTCDTESIQSNALYVYNFIVKSMGFKEQNIVVMGRSIGTGFAIKVAAANRPGALVLVSPFTGLKEVASEMLGWITSLLVEEKFDNLVEIRKVVSPVLIIHGQKDSTIDVSHGKKLKANCLNSRFPQAIYPAEMEHNEFDYYSDISSPIRDFLLKVGMRLYQQGMHGPVIADSLYARE